MIFSTRHRFISFACGRTGTTSLERALAHYDEGDTLRQKVKVLSRERHGRSFNPKHVRPDFLREFVAADLWDRMHKFVFVRDPWDWVLSQHCVADKSFFSLKRPVLGAEEVQAVWNRLRKNNQSLDQDSYLQSRFVYGPDGEQMVDEVGRYENLEADILRILDRLGLPAVELPHVNGTRHRHYARHYTPAGRDKVAELYRRDIELLGYSYRG